MIVQNLGGAGGHDPPPGHPGSDSPVMCISNPILLFPSKDERCMTTLLIQGDPNTSKSLENVKV